MHTLELYTPHMAIAELGVMSEDGFRDLWLVAHETLNSDREAKRAQPTADAVQAVLVEAQLADEFCTQGLESYFAAKIEECREFDLSIIHRYDTARRVWLENLVKYEDTRPNIARQVWRELKEL